MKSNFFSKILISTFIFIISLFFIGQNLDKPFWGEHDWNGVRYGNIARNYLRYGLINLKFAQIENSGPVAEKYEYFTHYPPLLPILISLSYRLVGISEWSTRLIPLLATSGTIVLIFLIGNKLWDLKTGILASSIAMVIPITLYFGKTPVHESLVVFFVLAAFLAYLYKRKKLFIYTSIFGCLTTWAGFFLIPAMILVKILTKNESFKSYLYYLSIPIALFIIYLGIIYLQTGSLFGGDLIGVFLQRSSLLSEVQPMDFNIISYLLKIRVWLFTLYSPLLVLIVLSWLVLLIKNKFSSSDLDLLIIGLFGVIYIIIFPNAVFIHNYLIMYLLPFFALAGSRMIWFLTKLGFMKNISLFLPVILIVAIISETKSFLDALNKSQGDKLAVLVGEAINQQTKFTDTVLVSPPEYQYSADKFLKFYGDRKLIYSNNVQINYNIRVLVNQEKGTFEIVKK